MYSLQRPSSTSLFWRDFFTRNPSVVFLFYFNWSVSTSLTRPETTLQDWFCYHLHLRPPVFFVPRKISGLTSYLESRPTPRSKGTVWEGLTTATRHQITDSPFRSVTSHETFSLSWYHLHFQTPSRRPKNKFSDIVEIRISESYLSLEKYRTLTQNVIEDIVVIVSTSFKSYVESNWGPHLYTKFRNLCVGDRQRFLWRESDCHT